MGLPVLNISLAALFEETAAIRTPSEDSGGDGFAMHSKLFFTDFALFQFSQVNPESCEKGRGLVTFG